jgi:hypothetical protein
MLINDTLVVEQCYKCAVKFAMPKSLRDQCLADHDRSFYCPNGHGQVYAGETEAQKLKRSLESAKDDAAFWRTRARHEEEQSQHLKRSRDAYKGRVTQLKNRAANGVCPCCNRYFANLHRHMNTKHPEFTVEGETQ